MKRSVGFCRMTNEGVFVNSTKLLSFVPEQAEQGLTDLYKQLKVEYPKFHKMDLMSKVCFLGVELLKEHHPALGNCEEDAVGLLFANSESSSHTDLKFKESYEFDKLPSPSLFVYTLPNIALGEIAIRNKWYGTQMFTVFPNFAPAYFTDYGRLMLDDGSKLVIGGWVDVRDRLNAAFFVMDDGFLSVKEEAVMQLTNINE